MDRGSRLEVVSGFLEPLPRVAGLAAMAGVMAVAVCLALSPIATTDFFWHLAAGDWIRETGRIPHTDPFTFTGEGRPWVDLHWGFQVAISWLHDHAGIDALVLLRAVLAALFAWLLLRSSGGKVTDPRTLAVGLVGVLASQERFLLRPELLTYVLLGTVLLLLREAPAGSRRQLLLVPLFVVWVNVHSLYAVGLAAVALAAVGAELDALRARRGLFTGAVPALAARWRSAALLVACGLACLANPYGLEAWRLPLLQLTDRIGSGNVWGATIGEFQRPELGGFGVVAVTASLALAIAAMTVVAVSWRSLPSRLILTAAAFTWLAWSARRNLPLLALGTVPLIVSGWTAAAARMAPRRLPRGVPRAAAHWALAALSCLLIFGITSNRLYRADGVDRRFGSGLREGLAPQGAVDFLARTVPDARVFHSLGDGGYLAWRRRPVLLDGRLEVHAEETYRAYLAALQDPAAFERLARRWDLDAVLLNHDIASTAAPLVRHLGASGAWSLAYFDAGAAVFLRSGTGAALDLAALAPGALGGLPSRTMGDRLLRRLTPWQVELPRVAPRVGVTLALLGHPGPAEAFLRAAAVDGELPPEVLYNLGRVAESAGRPAEAAARYREALDRTEPLRAPLEWAARRDLRVALRARLDGLSGAEEGPDGARTLALQARKLQDEGRPDLAAERYRQAIDLAPGEADLHHNLGLALLRSGQAAEAQGSGERLRETLEAAAAAFRTAADLRPGFAPSHYQLGVTLLMLGDPSAAAASLEEGLRLDPRRSDYHHVLALALQEMGRYPAAVRELDTAIELEPRRVAAHMDRFRLLRLLGRTDEARRELAKLRRLVDADDPVQSRIDRLEATLE